MKKFFKFIGLTVITFGLYPLWKLVSLPFRKSRPKLHKDWEYFGHFVIKLRKHISKKDKKVVFEEFLAAFPDLTDKELEVLFDKLRAYGCCFIGVDRLEYENSYECFRKLDCLRYYHRNAKRCCGGDYSNNICGCGLNVDADEVGKTRMIVEDEWSPNFDNI